MKKGDKAGEIMAGRKKEVSIVAEDQNWRSYITNELKCADIWDQDWGFLASQNGRCLQITITSAFRQLRTYLIQR